MRLKFLVTTLSCLLVACGGGGSTDPILGTPDLSPVPPVISPAVPPVITPTVPPVAVITAPRVILTTPAKLTPIATNIAPNVKLTAKFSRDMLASTVNATNFTVACPTGTPVTGTVTYDATNRLAILQHATAFPDSTTCTATISTATTDTAGVALAKNYVWSFTTSNAADTTTPTIVANSPPSAAPAVCLGTNVNVTFSEPIDSATLTAANFYVDDAASALVAGTLSYDSLSNTATFAASTSPGFAANTVYTSHVTTGVKDLAGVALATASNVSFTTGTLACGAVETVALGTIATYGAFGGGAGTTNSGINTVVNGDLGTTAACTLFTGFHDVHNVYTETTLNIGEVTGDIYCGPPAPGTTDKLAIATLAAADALTAYNALAAKTPTTTLNTGELGGRTLPPATYKPAASTLLLSTGNLTLDAAGDANAMWVFQIPTSLTIGLIATPRSVLLINGAQAKNVFWQVGSAARIENGSTMVGTIIASAGVTISTAGQTAQTTLIGRAIGLNASVTMVNTTIVAP